MITILMLIPLIALLVGSNMVITGYASQVQSTVNLVSSPNIFVASETPMSFSSFNQINGSKGVSWAIPYLRISAHLYSKNYISNTSILATCLNTFAEEKHTQVLNGSLDLSSGQADIGIILARILNVSVGDKVGVDALSRRENFTISGILSSRDQSDTELLLPIKTAWSIWPSTQNQISSVEFQASTPPILPQGIQVTSEQALSQISRSFFSQTSTLLALWSYVLIALSAIVSVSATYRIIAGNVDEFSSLRSIGTNLLSARKFLIYQVLIVAGLSVIIGTSIGIASTDAISTFARAITNSPLFSSINPTQLAFFDLGSFLLIFFVGTIIVMSQRFPTEIPRPPS